MMALVMGGVWASGCAASAGRGEDLPAEETDAGGTGQEPYGGQDPAFGDGGLGDAGDRCTEAIDVVLALDVTSSMNFVLDALENEIQGVVTAANGIAQGAHFGLVIFADNHKVDDSGSQGKIHTTADTLKTAFANAQSVYTKNNRNPGDGPTGLDTQNPICEENALDALHAAAKDFPWRAYATRVVIVVTDDTFLEAGDNYGDRDGDGKTDKTNYPREGNYPALTTMPQTVQALRDGGIRVFSVTRLKPPGPLDFLSKCGTPRRYAWDDVSAGWSKPYKGHAPIPDQTDGQNFDLDAVRKGNLSLGDTINKVVADSHCRPPK